MGLGGVIRFIIGGCVTTVAVGVELAVSYWLMHIHWSIAVLLAVVGGLLSATYAMTSES